MFLTKVRNVTAVLFLVALLAGVGAAPARGQEKQDKGLQPGDRVNIQVTGTLPNQPIHGVFQVEATGHVALGPGYGRVQVKGMNLVEAEAAVVKHLLPLLREVSVSVTRFDPVIAEAKTRDLERRVQQLEKELRELREVVEALKKKAGK
jgi:protein involved in polysaccharide export with SLBB domain